MSTRSPRLELLAPARDADCGIEAIRHGADAVYIGAPAFGARASAPASIADIERLARFARRFNARTLVALNTILYDDELERARELVWQIYEAGADALIVQDLGLLELDLPPIALHASTQTDIRTPEKARFLQDVGFSQLVLARELKLAEIRAIAEVTDATLEFFVHGALCVSYSGQCYVSHAASGRSANRGECSQMCRLPWTLSDGDGRVLARDSHLLSLKDNDQSANLRALVDAGIRSFKIEGRLKDLAYVKNVTAHYRQQIDAILEAGAGAPLRRSSSGRSVFTFTPQPEKTFNRGRTDYFLNGRQQEIAAFATPGFAGDAIGQVLRVNRDSIDLRSTVALANGDGLSFFKADGSLGGLRVNRAEKLHSAALPSPRVGKSFSRAGQAAAVSSEKRGTAAAHGGKPEQGKSPGEQWRIWPASMEALGELRPGQTLQRNRDQDFERLLEKPSAERRIALSVRFSEAHGEDGSEGFALQLTDEAGVSASVFSAQPWQRADDDERAEAAIRNGLSRLGETIYVADAIEIALAAPRFIPASQLNALRRQAVAQLDAAREAAAVAARRADGRRPETSPPPLWPQEKLDFHANVANAAARAFWQRHGVTDIEAAFEIDGGGKGEVTLMTMRHCLRFNFGGCPKVPPTAEATPLSRKPTPLTLSRGKQRFTLRFDCKNCEMQLVGQGQSPNRPPTGKSD
ncbi:peptidase U32 family protein [Rhodocyclus purpureus]|uniref:peptidase U32 family protein n=1 Tax=Rhodocyclus purpureus TaxID=1067 RepID=UPI001913A3D0|nr:U32 family peptidase [Rhodocyclus purpureus]MBK5915600.1 hypothetical protein [Rhodocyclus purpureus]